MNLLAGLLIAAAVAYALARWLRLPPLPMLIGSGMVLNVTGLLPQEFGLSDGGGTDATVGLIQLGLLYLVFASGVELNPRRFARHGATVVWIGVLQFSIFAWIGYLSARWMGFEPLEAVYLGFGLAASSTLVVLRQIRTRQSMFEPFGRVVTGVLLIQDILIIGVIVVLSRLEHGAAGIGGGLGATAVLGCAAWLVQRYLIPNLLKRVKPDEEGLLLWLMAVLCGFVGIAHAMDIPLIAGAFAGGFVFSAFPLNGLVRGQLSTLTDFFQAVFFVALGALVGVPDTQQWLCALQFTFVIVVFTPPLVAALAEWRGLSARASIESGLLLAQTSEYSLLLGLVGLASGHVTGTTFQVLALTTLITMTLASVIGRESVARLLLPLHPFRKKVEQDKAPSGHILLLGFGAAGMWTVKPLRAQDEDVLVVDDDAVVCSELESRGVSVMRGDGSDPDVLAKAGAAKAKLIIASMRRASDTLKVLEHVHGVPVVSRVFEQSEADVIRKAGGIPILNSMAAADVFSEWFDANDRLHPPPSSRPGPR
ncbi:MAG: cation:proton antiporter [Luteolibacter sp.]